MKRTKYIKRNGKEVRLGCVEGRLRVKEFVSARSAETLVSISMLEDNTLALRVTNHALGTQVRARFTPETFTMLHCLANMMESKVITPNFNCDLYDERG